MIKFYKKKHDQASSPPISNNSYDIPIVSFPHFDAFHIHKTLNPPLPTNIIEYFCDCLNIAVCNFRLFIVEKRWLKRLKNSLNSCKFHHLHERIRSLTCCLNTKQWIIVSNIRNFCENRKKKIFIQRRIVLRTYTYGKIIHIRTYTCVVHTSEKNIKKKLIHSAAVALTQDEEIEEDMTQYSHT